MLFAVPVLVRLRTTTCSGLHPVAPLSSMGQRIWSTHLSLAGCDTAMSSLAGSMVESASRAEAARLEAQGNPQFTDARLQAIVRDFEAEYAFYGRDLEKLEAGATRCPLAPKDAFELLRAVDYDEPQADNAKSGQTS